MAHQRTGTDRTRSSWSGLGRGVLRHTHVHSHPRLVGAAALAILLYFALWGRAGIAARLLIATDGGALVFLAAVWIMMASATPEGMRRRAEREDEGRYTVLVLSVAAAIAILLTIVFELHGIKDLPPALAALHVALAAGTILLSWLFMNTIFALHYAHGYYGDADPSSDYKPVGGLVFLFCRGYDLSGIRRADQGSRSAAPRPCSWCVGLFLQRHHRRPDHQHCRRPDLKALLAQCGAEGAGRFTRFGLGQMRVRASYRRPEAALWVGPRVALGSDAFVCASRRLKLLASRCFSLFFQEIYSERSVVFRRNPGPQPIGGPKYQRNARCSAAVFGCFCTKEQQKSRNRITTIINLSPADGSNGRTYTIASDLSNKIDISIMIILTREGGQWKPLKCRPRLYRQKGR